MKAWAAMLTGLALALTQNLAPASAVAAEPAHPAVRTGHNLVELVPQTDAVAPGSTVYVALRQTIAPGWHTYWRNPGDAGQPTALAWTLPPGWRAGDIVWPAPERDLSGPIMNYVLTGEVYLPVPVHVPADAKPGQAVTLKAAATWLVCKDVCVPEQADLSLTLPVARGTPPADPRFGAAIQHELAAAPKPSGFQARYQVVGATAKLGVVGAPRAHHEGYAYSAALKGKEGDWTYAELDKWLLKPSAYAPGTKMSFAGVADPKVRADVIAYLRSLSANPEPLPTADAAKQPG